MSLKKDYKAFRTGPGGMHCPCCGVLGVCPSKAKPMMRRINRRKAKIALKAEYV